MGLKTIFYSGRTPQVIRTPAFFVKKHLDQEDLNCGLGSLKLMKTIIYFCIYLFVSSAITYNASSNFVPADYNLGFAEWILIGRILIVRQIFRKSFTI